MATKKAPKKIATKAQTTSTSQTKKAATATSKASSRESDSSKSNEKLDAIMESINSELGIQVVRRADSMETLYLLRRPTGITSLDIALAGGFPASATTVLVGPDGAGKDYLLWRTAAEVQKIYGEDFCMCVFFTEFKADKPFMRNLCGLKIAFSEEEIRIYDKARTEAGHEPLSKEERAELRTQIGKILIIDGVVADTGFDAIIRLVEANQCQMVVINSIGSLQTAAKEEKDSFEEHAKQSNEAVLLSKFVPKLAMTLNNDREGRNETSIFIVNQMRAKRDAMPVRGRPTTEKDKYTPGANVWALKHGKAIELSIHKSSVHRDEVDKSILGRCIKWELTKGKLGTHDGISGEFDFFYEGGADVLKDLIDVCKKMGLIEGTRSFSYEHPDFGFKVNSKESLRMKIQSDPELFDHLRKECLRKSQVIYTWR